MSLTELTVTDLKPEHNSFMARCRKAIADFFGLGEPPMVIQSTSQKAAREAPSNVHIPLRVVTSATELEPPMQDFRWRRHPQLLEQPTSQLADHEREARHHAVRGLYAARAGALTCAEHHFTQAAACEDIDLCEIPGFWQLPRAAMLTAVSAYERADRLRDASALNARVRTLYRPKAMRPAPENVTEFSSRSMPLSINS